MFLNFNAHGFTGLGTIGAGVFVVSVWQGCKGGGGGAVPPLPSVGGAVTSTCNLPLIEASVGELTVELDPDDEPVPGIWQGGGGDPPPLVPPGVPSEQSW